ncbi:hypothetical protein N9D43_01040 [Luminiphilus sp.]|nr:hypothetical protein [Luminiphilus sp.]
MNIIVVDHPRFGDSTPTHPTIELVTLDFGSHPGGGEIRHFVLSAEKRPSSQDEWCLWDVYVDTDISQEPKFALLAFCNKSLFRSQEAAGSGLLVRILSEQFSEVEASAALPEAVISGGLLDKRQIALIYAEACATERCLTSWVKWFENTGLVPAAAEFIAADSQLLTIFRDTLAMWDGDLYGVIDECSLVLEDEDLGDYLLPELPKPDRESVLNFMSGMVERVEESYPNALSLKHVCNTVVAIESCCHGKWYEAESLRFFRDRADCYSYYRDSGCYLNGDPNADPDFRIWKETYLIDLFNEKLAARLGAK